MPFRRRGLTGRREGDARRCPTPLRRATKKTMGDACLLASLARFGISLMMLPGKAMLRTFRLYQGQIEIPRRQAATDLLRCFDTLTRIDRHAASDDSSRNQLYLLFTQRCDTGAAPGMLFHRSWRACSHRRRHSSA